MTLPYAETLSGRGLEIRSNESGSFDAFIRRMERKPSWVKVAEDEPDFDVALEKSRLYAQALEMFSVTIDQALAEFPPDSSVRSRKRLLFCTRQILRAELLVVGSCFGMVINRSLIVESHGEKGWTTRVYKEGDKARVNEIDKDPPKMGVCRAITPILITVTKPDEFQSELTPLDFLSRNQLSSEKLIGQP